MSEDPKVTNSGASPGEAGAKASKAGQKIRSRDHEQPHFFKKKRRGEQLTRKEIRKIKKGRRELRKQMKAQGIGSRQSFERVAAELGLYFDAGRFFPIWAYLQGKGVVTAAVAAGAALAATLGVAAVTEMKGNFTINLTDSLFREGMVLSDTASFEVTTSKLYSDPVLDAPCISIISIPEDICDYDGSNNGTTYFSYTFYARNEGETIIDYSYSLCINSESLNLSEACWVALFEDDQVRIFAKENSTTGEPEALPAFTDTTRGYLLRPFYDSAMYPELQYEVVYTTPGGTTFYRIVPFAFESDTVVVSGEVLGLEPMEVRKYTVVIWLEGDDPDCTDDLIGGHLGLDMQFELISSRSDGVADESTWGERFVSAMQSLFDSLKFWED